MSLVLQLQFHHYQRKYLIVYLQPFVTEQLDEIAVQLQLWFPIVIRTIIFMSSFWQWCSCFLLVVMLYVYKVNQSKTFFCLTNWSMTYMKTEKCPP